MLLFNNLRTALSRFDEKFFTNIKAKFNNNSSYLEITKTVFILKITDTTMKSKKKKDDPGTPSKTALNSDYDAESGLNNPDSSGGAQASTSGLSRSSSKKSKRSRKNPRFSIRNWIFNNPIFPPPFGQPGTTSVGNNPGTSGTSRASRKSESANNPDQSQSWRDNVSSHSQGQTEGSLRECPLCFAQCTLDQFPHLRNCPHLFCMECLHTYTKLEIQEGRVNLKCPQCTELIHPNGKKLDHK